MKSVLKGFGDDSQTSEFARWVPPCPACQVCLAVSGVVSTPLTASLHKRAQSYILYRIDNAIYLRHPDMEFHLIYAKVGYSFSTKLRYLKCASLIIRRHQKNGLDYLEPDIFLNYIKSVDERFLSRGMKKHYYEDVRRAIEEFIAYICVPERFFPAFTWFSVLPQVGHFLPVISFAFLIFLFSILWAVCPHLHAKICRKAAANLL